jgi:hypothetical protein
MSFDVASALAGVAVTPAERLVLPSGRLIAAEPTAGFPAGTEPVVSSPEVFEALTDDQARDDLIADLSFDTDEPCATYTDPASDANLVAFGIGADGRYLTWTGRTATGEVACFLADFGGLFQPF